MDEILYLESDEEITSVIDKIKQSKTNRLCLVVPRDATLLQSVVNLKLLLKEASNLGKNIALVTADKIGRNLAAKVGLVVYESIKVQQPLYQPPPPVPTAQEIIEINDAAPAPAEQEQKPKGVSVHHFQEQTKKWQKPPTPPKTQTGWSHQPTVQARPADWSKWKKVIWPLSALVLILILIGAFLVLPKVEVKLKVKSENYQGSTDIQVSSEQATSIENKIFPGKLVDITKEKEDKFPTTGKRNLGGKASGTITIYNNLDSNAHSFAAGTKLSSSSKTFILKDSVSVPGATVQNLKIVPGSVNAEIEAENPGEDYNVKAGRFTIVGLSAGQQEAIYGQSSKDLTGGFSKEVQVVSQTDYDGAKAKMIQELNDNLKKELQGQSSGLAVLDEATQIDLVEETSSAKVDSEATEFNLKIKERLRAMVFDRNNFNQFVIKILEARLPSDKMLSLGPNDLISPQIKEKKYDQGSLSLEAKVSAQMSSRVDIQKVKENLLGKSQKQSQDYLNHLDGIDSSEIRYSPSWWPIKRIANLKRNLTVSLEYLAEENTNFVPESSPTPEISPTATLEAR